MNAFSGFLADSASDFEYGFHRVSVIQLMVFVLLTVRCFCCCYQCFGDFGAANFVINVLVSNSSGSGQNHPTNEDETACIWCDGCIQI